MNKVMFSNLSFLKESILHLPGSFNETPNFSGVNAGMHLSVESEYSTLTPLSGGRIAPSGLYLYLLLNSASLKTSTTGGFTSFLFTHAQISFVVPLFTSWHDCPKLLH